jgi:DNA-binding response OmpR family regulator
MKQRISEPPTALPEARESAQASGPANRERRFRPSSTMLAAVPTQVVIDDKMSKHVDTEVSEADFGDVARELSVVAEFPKEPPPKTESTAGKKKLLVVDDELEIRKLLRRVLEENGYAVVEADRGRTALQALKVEAPDLVILDAMLPEIHGFDIARRIRGSTRFAHVPIIMVSAVYRGWRIAEDVKANYGVDAYIEKPFRVGDVVAAVEEALKARKQPVDAERISAEAEQLLNDGVAAYRAGDLERATELLVQGTKVDPLAYRLRFHLGLLYGKRGQVYDAIQQLERAVEIQGKHFASVKNLAILYQQAGFKNKAVETWQRALHIAPDDETRKTIKEHLVGLL